MPKHWKRDAALVLAAVALAYANALLNGFAYDDVGIIQRNPVVTGPGSLRDIWLAPYWPIHGEVLGLYRPVTIAFLAAQWALADGAAWFFHAVSVLLHASVSLLLLGLLRRLMAPTAALFGALLFALHPLHTESVANLVGQAELLAAGASLGAAWIWSVRGERPGTGRLAAVAALYAFGVLAKEHAIVLPALLLALDLALGRVRHGDARAYLRSVAPAAAALAMVAGGVLGLRFAALGSPLDGRGLVLPYHQFWAALRAWPEYMRLLVFPLDLASDYSPGVILPPQGPSPVVLLGGVLLLAIIALAATTPRWPRAGLPAAWFFVTILPVSGLLFPIGLFPLGVFVGERTLYLPSVAIAIAGGHVVDAAARLSRERRRALALAGAVVLVLFGVRTVLRNPAWRDSAASARTLFVEHPESYRAQWEAAQASFVAGDTAAAADHYRLAHRLWPYDPGFLTAYGVFLTQTGYAAEAIPLLEEARVALPFSARTEAALAEAYLRAGRPRQALESAARLGRLGGATEYSIILSTRARSALRDGETIR